MAKRSKSDPAEDAVIEVMAMSGDGEWSVPPEALPVTVGDLIASVAESVVPAARNAGPDKFGVEFGVRTRRDGSAVLADDPRKATIRVFMEWSRTWHD
jgi:hypothetical protein